MPADISLFEKDILINGVSTQLVAGSLRASGLTDDRIGEILGWWYVGATGDTRPVPFDFATDVQTSDPSNDITYSRSFAHTDWVDGEDRVQASATPEELGFNARFHAIENEFDAIRDQFVRLGAGARELRSDLVGVLRELESKITALQNELFDLRQQVSEMRPKVPGGLGVIGTVKVGDKSAFVTQVGNDFQLLEFAGTTLGETVKAGPLVKPGAVFDPAQVRPDEILHTIAGLEDLLVTPDVRKVVERPGATVADLRSAVGGTLLPTGVSIASILAPLPADQLVPGVAGTVEMLTSHLVAQLPEATAAKLREELVTDATARAGTPAEIGTASVEVVGLSAGIVGALAGAGVDTTVSGMARLTTATVAHALSSAGVSVSNDAIRDAVARSRIVTALAVHP